MNTGKKSLGVLLGIGGILLFSVKAILVKLAYNYDIDALTLLMFRMLFALPFYLIVLFFFLPVANEKLTSRDYLWLVIFGFLGYYISSYLDFLGLQHIKASLERIILFIYPTLVLIISRIFLKTKIHLWQVGAIAITYFGIFIAFSEELKFTSEDSVLLGGGLVLAAAITYASYIVGSGWLIPKFGSVRFTTLCMLVSATFIIGHFVAVSDVDIFSFEKELYLICLAMGLLSTVLASFMVSESIKLIGAPNFGILGSIGPISTIVMAYLFLGEKMTLIQWFGAFIVIGGVMMVARKK